MTRCLVEILRLLATARWVTIGSAFGLALFGGAGLGVDRVASVLGLPLPRTSLAFAGPPLVATDIMEAGSIFDPSDGSGVRYLTALDPTRVVHEARSSLGVPLGDLRRAPDLSSTPPAATDPGSSLDLRDLDGVTPFTGPLYHPTLVETPAGDLGLYAIDAIPTGTIHYFVSSDAGATWVLTGFPELPGFGGGSGLFAVMVVPNAVHVDGFEVRAYYQDGGGALRLVQSSIVAPGPTKFYTLDLTTDQLVLGASAAGPGLGFTPAGGVVRFDSGDYGLFFVPQSDAFIGLAVSPNGLTDWAVTRGPSDPILSTAMNPDAPDPARTELKEITVCPEGDGYRILFTGAIPGGFPFDRAVGSCFVGPFVPGAFVRGDCNDDGAVELSDAVCSLAYLFSGGSAVCLDALDANDSGGIDISDPVAVLEYLFSGGATPPAPFPSCGADLTADAVDCAAATACP